MLTGESREGPRPKVCVSAGVMQSVCAICRCLLPLDADATTSPVLLVWALRPLKQRGESGTQKARSRSVLLEKRGTLPVLLAVARRESARAAQSSALNAGAATRTFLGAPMVVVERSAAGSSAADVVCAQRRMLVGARICTRAAVGKVGTKEDQGAFVVTFSIDDLSSGKQFPDACELCRYPSQKNVKYLKIFFSS